MSERKWIPVGGYTIPDGRYEVTTSDGMIRIANYRKQDGWTGWYPFAEGDIHVIAWRELDRPYIPPMARDSIFSLITFNAEELSALERSRAYLAVQGRIESDSQRTAWRKIHEQFEIMEGLSQNTESMPVIKADIEVRLTAYEMAVLTAICEFSKADNDFESVFHTPSERLYANQAMRKIKEAHHRLATINDRRS